MATAIYQLTMMKRTAAWYQTSQEVREHLSKEIRASLEARGWDNIVQCVSNWSSEPWQGFGLNRFPDVNAVQKHRMDTNQLDWPQYVEALSVLGTARQQASTADMTKPIYKAFMGKYSEAWHQLSNDDQERLIKTLQDHRDEVGGKVILSCDSSWCSDRWQFFGLEAFPDIEAVHGYANAMAELKWLRYVDGISLLGTDWQPT